MAIFWKFLKFYLNFPENLGKWKFWKYGILVGWGEGEPPLPPKLAKILKKVAEKSMETWKLWNFIEFLANFDFKKLILIIIKAILMEFWKSLIILKEINKPSDKSLRVWAKNQLRFEIFEKILKFTYQNFNGKVIFYPFYLQDFCHFIHLWNVPKIFGLAWRG